MNNGEPSVDDVETRFQQARERHMRGEWETAAAGYRDVIARDPRHFRAWTNLGDCLDRTGSNADAEAAFERACEAAPDEPRPRYNLARQRHLRGDLAAAEADYRRALDADPRMVAAILNLGRLLEESGRADEADRTLQTAAAIEPESALPQLLLGHVRFGQHRPVEALTAYQRAAELAPQGETHFHVGKTLHAMRRLEEAVQWYRRALALEPRSRVARESLARALGDAGARDAAIAVLREWLEATPDEPIARHMLAALGADAAPERASDDYVRSTFDSFAEVFDRTLARLDYRAPQLVVDAIAGHAGAPRGTLDVLDAGCGTGLCGPLLRPYARALVGVDLSARMLDQARLRGSYDELVEAELTACLRDRRDAFDLVACADTLCYFGALDDVLAAAAATLRPGGLLAFTVERLDAPADAGSAADHRLLAHGRYAHARSYVERALGAAGLLVKHIDDCHLRNESGTPVAGLVVVALRPALRPETRRSAS